MRTPALTALAGALVLIAPLAACSNDPEAQEAAPAAKGSTTTCSYPVGGGAAKPVDPPSEEAPNTGMAEVTLTIDSQPVRISMDRSKAPCTVNSFESLAKQGWFTKMKCHRLTTEGIFVLQCGDPTGTGAGGPGYSFADELEVAKSFSKVDARSVNYAQGTVAMANAGPGTNGSQFFLVWEDSPLPPAYTAFGTMDADSVKAVGAIAGQGTATGGPDGPPKAPALIEQATLG